MPCGFTKVPVTLVQGVVEIPTEMIAGSIGIRATRAKEQDKADETRPLGLDTLQPEVGWFIYKI
jgi:hypothetical protein